MRKALFTIGVLFTIGSLSGINGFEDEYAYANENDGGQYVLEFDGESSYVEVDSPFLQDVHNSGEVTYHVEYKEDNNINTRSLISRGTSSSYDNYSGCQYEPLIQTHRIKLSGCENSGSIISHFNERDNRWIDLTTSFSEENDQYIVYINGEEVTKGSISEIKESSSNESIMFNTVFSEMIIGAMDASGNIVSFFNGQIRDLKIFDKGLSESEILDLHNGNFQSDHVVADWDFSSGEGDTLYDKSRNDNHGTIVNAEFVNVEEKVTFTPDSNDNWAKNHNTTVNVENFDPDYPLEYAWSTSVETPTSGWTNFNDGDEISLSNETGIFYLHVRGTNMLGEEFYDHSEAFYIDNTPPTHISSNVEGYRYQDGTDYWVQPEDQLTITYRQRDTDSGNQLSVIRLIGNNQDVRYQHDFANHERGFKPVNRDLFGNTESIEVLSANRTEHDESRGYGTVEWDVLFNTHGHNYNINYFYRDNAINDRVQQTVGKVRVDGVAPTLNITPDTTEETHENVTLTIDADDEGSGVRRLMYTGDNVIQNGDFNDEDNNWGAGGSGGNIEVIDGKAILNDNSVSRNKLQQSNAFMDSVIGTTYYAEIVARGEGTINARYAFTNGGVAQENYKQELKSADEFKTYRFLY